MSRKVVLVQGTHARWNTAKNLTSRIQEISQIKRLCTQFWVLGVSWDEWDEVWEQEQMHDCLSSCKVPAGLNTLVPKRS